jgi:hypothetical protein
MASMKLLTLRTLLVMMALGTAWPLVAQPVDPAVAVVCGSKPGERQTCVADTTGGVSLVRSTGAVACELGTSWGFDEKSIWVRDGCSAEFSLGTRRASGEGFGAYTPGRGFKVADTAKGDMFIRLFGVARYLNQRGLDDTYTDSVGVTRPVQQRQDIQVNKAIVFFQGSLMSPKFLYNAYVWTTNTSQGLPAQVVVAGFFAYAFNPRVTAGVGIYGLPGARSTEGQWPSWLGVDERLIADEFFRPSYTTGVFARGEVAKGLRYSVMWGDNLSQLGVDAGQLGNNMSAVSGALIWMPTTGEFGPGAGGFGDFERHDKVATRIGIHYTFSDEDRQEQPGTEAPDNSQIRLSDGNIVFAPGLFGPGINVSDVRYQMESLDAGVKHRGFALEGEYYWRRLSDFRGTGTAALPFDHLTDTGFQLQASAMVVPKAAQLYLSGSKIFGNYGNPSDVRAGVNVFPWKNQAVRWNTEFINLNHSPVGYLAVPFPVGGNGPVFHTNLEVAF